MKQLKKIIISFIKWIVLGFKGKNSWDWLQLLIVPVLLAGSAFYLDNQSEKRQESVAKERYENETTLADERAKQETLNNYFSQMKDLLLSEGLRKASADSEVRSVARAITTTTVKNLDGDRNALVIDFLGESNLLKKPEETNTNPKSKQLKPILSFAELNLTGADLSEVNLSQADLSEANLSQADLSEANLSRADLSQADLSEANLSRADLSGADLNGANLSGTNMTDVKDITREQISLALLCNTQLSKEIEQDLDLDRDCNNLSFELPIMGF
jgi:uncharacterized protein YjbI with pentapeptide repeats